MTNCETSELLVQYPDTPFSVSAAVKEYGPGTWDGRVVSVHRDGVKIGEYERNYSSFAANTFRPFMLDGQWYALYSREYTATRVMRLYPDRIEDWCGEDADSFGFCPVEYFVPRYRLYEREHLYTYERGEKLAEPRWSPVSDVILPDEFDAYRTIVDSRQDDEKTRSRRLSDVLWTPFGFLAGCIWGDDSSWKIQYLDLSNLAARQMTRHEKFGYVQMPARMHLNEAIDLSSWQPGHNWVGVSHTKFWNLDSGETED